MISLADVAKKAGVSIATASQALRGRGQVAAKTAEIVRQAAEDLGYRPNPLLASLATKRFRSQTVVEGTPLAILEFNFEGRPATRSSMHEYSKAILPVARSLGYAPTIYQLENESPVGPLNRELYHRMVQGIIIVGNMDMKKFGAAMPWENFAVVACARFMQSLPFHTVRPNIFQGIKLAFERLRACGYRRIGYALGRHDVPIEDDDARHGAAIALENRCLAPEDRIPPFEGAIGDRNALVDWLRTHQPDAVVVFSTGYYWHFVDAGYDIPKDLGLACLHLGTVGEKVRFSGLNQNRAEIARQSVLQIDQMIRTRERGIPALPLNILVPSSWIEGDTLRKAPRPKKARK